MTPQMLGATSSDRNLSALQRGSGRPQDELPTRQYHSKE
jgi:hypothetical protein